MATAAEKRRETALQGLPGFAGAQGAFPRLEPRPAAAPAQAVAAPAPAPAPTALTPADVQMVQRILAPATATPARVPPSAAEPTPRARAVAPAVASRAVSPAPAPRPTVTGPREGDIEVIRGGVTSYATPELGYANELSAANYFGSLFTGGDLSQAAEVQRLGMIPAQAISADATIQGAEINAAADIQRAGIAAGSQAQSNRAARDIELLKLLGTPVQGGGEIASDPSNPLLPGVAVPTFQQRVLDPATGAITFKPMGAAAARGAGNKVPGQIYTDANGRRAVYQADGTFKEIK